MKKLIFLIMLFAGLASAQQTPYIFTPQDTLGQTTLDSIGSVDLKYETVINRLRIHNLSYDSTQTFYVKNIVRNKTGVNTYLADTSFVQVREDSTRNEFVLITVPPRSTKDYLILNEILGYVQIVRVQGTGAGKTAWYIRGKSFTN